MKVYIEVIRRVKFARIVEMDRSKFFNLYRNINSIMRAERRTAEKEVNAMIKPSEDWQDDELSEISEFREAD